MCATDAWPRVWRATYRWVRSVLEPALYADPDVQRVSALVSVENMPARRFMVALGFEQEGVHRCVGADGSDWITYARVKA
jgi:RimJ/RimL family protein N-acetyltransferase